MAALGPDDLARSDGGDLTLIRAPEAETSGRVRLGYVEEGAHFEMRMAEVSYPGDSEIRATGTDLPLVMTEGEAALVAERWLAQARVARDVARFRLPPSSALGAGDVVALDMGFGPSLWRIDRVTLAAGREVEAARVEDAVYEWGETARASGARLVHVAPAPVSALFLDLPLLTGEEVAHHGRLAVLAQGWPGLVSVHRQTGPDSYDLEALVRRPARVGVSESALPAARAGLWDRGRALRVRMVSGQLGSVTPGALLGGANLAAIGDGVTWEMFQFAEAELVSEGVYDLRMRLRGQRGTDGVMPALWPAGTMVVMLDEALEDLPLPLDAVGLERRYRVGPASRPLSDPSQRDFSTVFTGVGLRPYRPVHLRARWTSGGDLEVTWIRRTRQGGDAWGAVEAPLGEAFERYVLRVRKGGSVVRQVEVDRPGWVYGAPQQAQDGADGADGAIAIEVAQLSEQYGPGPFAVLELAA